MMINEIVIVDLYDISNINEQTVLRPMWKYPNIPNFNSFLNLDKFNICDNVVYARAMGNMNNDVKMIELYSTFEHKIGELIRI